MKIFFAICALVFGFALTSMAPSCGSTAVLSGCVGACGSSYSASYTVQASDIPPYADVAEFCLAATSNSLCPSDNAFATMRVNNGRQITGNLNLGDVLSMKAAAGDVIYITVTDVFVNPKVQCIWLGETHFSLTR